MKIRGIDVLFWGILFLFSLLFWWKFVFSSSILIHGDFRYGLSVKENIYHHLKEAYQLPKIPFLFILYLLSKVFGDIVAEKLFTVIILFLSLIWVYLAHKYFLSKVFSELQNGFLSFCAFVGTIVFLFNPWTINRTHHHYWLVFALAASYFMLAKIDELLHNSLSIKKILFLSLLFSAVASAVQAIIIYLGFMLLIYLVTNLIIDRTKFLTEIYSKKKSLLFILIFIFLLNTFWLMPFLSIIFEGKATPNYPIEPQNVNFLSERGTILYVIEATNRFIWNGKGWLATPKFDLPFNIWQVSPLFLFTIVFLTLFFLSNYSKRNTIFFFTILLVLSILIACGTKAPFIGKLYEWIFLNMPLGWVIRDPYKNTGVVIICIAFFNSVSIYLLFQQKIQFKILLITCLLFLPFLWGWPILTGDLNGHLKFLTYPKDLDKCLNYLQKNNKSNYSILWYPKGKPIFFYHDIPELSSSSLNTLSLTPEIDFYIETLIKKGDIEALRRLFNLVGVKYVILRTDLNPYYRQFYSSLFTTIKKAKILFPKTLRISYNSENFTIFENPSSVRIFHLINNFVLDSSPYFLEMVKIAENNLTTITSVKKSGFRKWEISLYSHNPFLLVFSKPFDRAWRAAIYKDNKKLVDQERALSILGIVNGFYIPYRGKLSIKIYYCPAIWYILFKIGAVISVLSFLYIVYRIVS